MDFGAIRLTIRRKLENGRLPLQLHLRCFEIWAQERASLLRQREQSAAPA